MYSRIDLPSLRFEYMVASDVKYFPSQNNRYTLILLIGPVFSLIASGTNF